MGKNMGGESKIRRMSERPRLKLMCRQVLNGLS